MAKMTYDENKLIFALDIGTRSVIGLVVTLQEGGFKVVAQAMVEHKSRAMLDGQIHDIPKVAEAVQKVKHDLEKKLRFKLNKVAIAAAGRSLKTRQCRIEQELTEDMEIDPVMVNSLELLGIQQAQELLEQETRQGEKEKFFCVGYSVINYYLNDYSIANLVGHRGKKIAANVLATFLPASVVNSLHAVLGRVNLEPLYLTLEPIAACEVVIPEQLRLLNLALVDVGAGTSDIAITSDGTITAYGMVPIAGDEITELIVDALMVDFMTAEQIKRSLYRGKKIKYNDILGLEMTATCEEILQIIEPAVQRLADEIARNIIELNGEVPPKSVMCVGGGSQVPLLTDKIAQKLGLVQQRVVIRNRTNINNLVDLKKKDLAGPEGVTVVGIAAVAAKRLGQNFINVTVNGQVCTLFNTRQLNVIHALGLVEFNPRQLLGRNGKDLQFALNGKPRTLYGELAKPAAITVNGKSANLQSEVKDGDVIFVKKAENGKDARAIVSDVLVEILGKATEVNKKQLVCLLNGEPVELEQSIAPGDVLEIKHFPTADSTNVVEEKKCVTPLEKTFPSPEQGNHIIEVNVNGQSIRLEGKREYILIDIFNYFALDVSKSNGTVEIKRNSNNAVYTEVLQDGDVIEISW